MFASAAPLRRGSSHSQLAASKQFPTLVLSSSLAFPCDEIATTFEPLVYEAAIALPRTQPRYLFWDSEVGVAHAPTFHRIAGCYFRQHRSHADRVRG